MHQQWKYWFSTVVVFTAATFCCALAAFPTRSSATAGTMQSAESEPEEQASSATNPRDVVTYHYGIARRGLTALETRLTPSNVNSASFGKIRFFPADGKVDAQPLFVNQMQLPPGPQNTLFVVTEHDSIYAFKADRKSVV